MHQNIDNLIIVCPKTVSECKFSGEWRRSLKTAILFE